MYVSNVGRGELSELITQKSLTGLISQRITAKCFESGDHARSNGNTRLVVVTADHETGGLMIVDGNEHTGRVVGLYNSDDHMPVMLPVFAYGPGSQNFIGVYENYEIARRIKSLTRK